MSIPIKNKRITDVTITMIRNRHSQNGIFLSNIVNYVYIIFYFKNNISSRIK
ncbi:hypothetical protein Hanom_Chr08g00727411 [Helianthus anomalus]